MSTQWQSPVLPCAPDDVASEGDAGALRESMARWLLYSLGKDRATATDRDWFFVAARAVRDCMMPRWMTAMRAAEQRRGKRVYYLSAEFLTGRLLSNSLLNLGR